MSSTAIRVEDASAVGEVRRFATDLADGLGLDDTVKGRVAIVATEAATNVQRHGGGGSVLLRAADDATGRYVEVLAIDSGRGIGDPDAALRDGFSTGGTSGTGLGAIRRLSASFDLWSERDRGTLLVARIGTVSSMPFSFGALSIAAPGETACGDAWSLHVSGARLRLVMVDGLGHGRGAETAARAAIESTAKTTTRTNTEALEAAHGALMPTRGAAMGVCDVDLVSRRLSWAGVGNISGLTVTERARHNVVSHPGIVGHTMRKVQAFEYEWPPYGVGVFHSDGVTTSWDLSKYPGILRRHPALIAAALFRDHVRGKDDATVVVIGDANR
jgi:anti-sigma regulatory factor (Ser/Thr protein kinase)